MWKDDYAHGEAGLWVDAVDLAVVDAPIVVGRSPDWSPDARTWRLSATGSSGRPGAVALGELHGGGRFHPDLDGDGVPEVLVGYVTLIAADRMGVVEREDAWLTSREPFETSQYFSIPLPCGDVNDDGHAELCLVPASDGASVYVWFSPLDAATFDTAAPDRVVALASNDVVYRVFGLTEPSGGRRLVVSAKLTDKFEVHDLASGTVVVTPHEGSPVAVGELDGLPGEEVVAPSYTSLDLYTIGASGGLEPTGAGLASTGAAVVVGDFDGDGANDLAVSESMQYERGWVRIYLGPFDSGYRSPADADLRLTTSSEGFGAAMSAADVDGDGRDDLVVGAPGDDTLGEDAGAAYLWLGADLFP